MRCAVRGHDLARRRASASAPAPAVGVRAGLLRPRRHAAPRRPSSARRSRASRVVRAGRRSRWPARCCSTWRSVSTTKPRLTASPARPASRPMPKAPAYHSGFSRLVRSPSSLQPLLRSRPGGRSPRARRARHLRAQRRAARGQRLRLVQRLGADFADMVDAHQRARTGAARRPTKLPLAPRGARSARAEPSRRGVSARRRPRSACRSMAETMSGQSRYGVATKSR